MVPTPANRSRNCAIPASEPIRRWRPWIRSAKSDIQKTGRRQRQNRPNQPARLIEREDTPADAPGIVAAARDQVPFQRAGSCKPIVEQDREVPDLLRQFDARSPRSPSQSRAGLDDRNAAADHDPVDKISAAPPRPGSIALRSHALHKPPPWWQCRQIKSRSRAEEHDQSLPAPNATLTSRPPCSTACGNSPSNAAQQRAGGITHQGMGLARARVAFGNNRNVAAAAMAPTLPSRANPSIQVKTITRAQTPRVCTLSSTGSRERPHTGPPRNRHRAEAAASRTFRSQISPVSF
jgi:hypothetical protein